MGTNPDATSYDPGRNELVPLPPVVPPSTDDILDIDDLISHIPNGSRPSMVSARGHTNSGRLPYEEAPRRSQRQPANHADSDPALPYETPALLLFADNELDRGNGRRGGHYAAARLRATADLTMAELTTPSVLMRLMQWFSSSAT